ncbi:hypothetical protein [Oceanobacillus oncorhynchi]|uniref:hypothetical protein n=1 Tax=Oceanobacillus oncorhynchi TaxID=545501 RepID=UPI0021161E0E|nr:hypothetical protein [Oceanobacillus oncorhynchi]UUI41171.1 hypothetical protein NP440_06285 [Oceanobacillus oncorhynchi]
MEYLIRYSAVEDFEKLFVDSIEESIRKMVNSKFLLRKSNYELSISFYENYIVFIKIENSTVMELARSSYEDFIPDEFIEIFLDIQNLPPRLKRYKTLGLNSFRNEIKESLKDGKIIVENNNVIWSDYNFCLKVDQNTKLEGILY